MNKYNINHPLRGTGYEKAPVYKQSFKDKIIGVVGGVNSYLSYQNNKREMLDTTQYDEKFLKEQHERFMKDRIMMKYRLYGLDGLRSYEIQQLKEWRIMKPLDHTSYRKVKKRVTRKYEDEDIEYSTDMSGSNESCYEYKKI